MGNLALPGLATIAKYFSLGIPITHDYCIPLLLMDDVDLMNCFHFIFIFFLRVSTYLVNFGLASRFR